MIRDEKEQQSPSRLLGFDFDFVQESVYEEEKEMVQTLVNAE